MASVLESVIIEPEQEADSAIIWLHGLGADGHDFAPIVQQLDLPEDHSIRFIFPHAPHQPVTLNFGMSMPAWYDIKGLALDSPEDDEGVRRAGESIMRLIEEQREQGIAAERIFLAGFSQGAGLALFTALRYQQSLAGVIALSAYLPLATTLAEEGSAENKQIPIFLAYGRKDVIITNELAYLSHQYLQDLDYEIDWHEYNIGHELCQEEIQAIATFINEHL